jgi:hypothetical protein
MKRFFLLFLIPLFLGVLGVACDDNGMEPLPPDIAVQPDLSHHD